MVRYSYFSALARRYSAKRPKRSLPVNLQLACDPKILDRRWASRRSKDMGLMLVFGSRISSAEDPRAARQHQQPKDQSTLNPEE
jgi:hypothetical protein